MIAARLAQAAFAATNPGAAFADPMTGGADIDVFRIVLSLVVCIFVALFAIFLIRRRGGSFSRLMRTPGDGPVIVETRRISLNAELCRLQWDGREFLLVVSQQGTTVLRERTLLAHEPETL